MSAGLRIVGLMGDSSPASLQTELTVLANGTGAIDSSNQPLVFDAPGSSSTSGLQTALLAIASGIPLDISAAVQDQTTDAVDTVAAFVDHIETLELGTPECPDVFMTTDENGDGVTETYRSAITGTPLCWRLVLKQNSSIAPASEPQMFPATVRILAEGEQILDERPIVFVVPP